MPTPATIRSPFMFYNPPRSIRIRIPFHLVSNDPHPAAEIVRHHFGDSRLRVVSVFRSASRVLSILGFFRKERWPEPQDLQNQWLSSFSLRRRRKPTTHCALGDAAIASRALVLGALRRNIGAATTNAAHAFCSIRPTTSGSLATTGRALRPRRRIPRAAAKAARIRRAVEAHHGPAAPRH